MICLTFQDILHDKMEMKLTKEEWEEYNNFPAKYPSFWLCHKAGRGSKEKKLEPISNSTKQNTFLPASSERSFWMSVLRQQSYFVSS